MKKHKIEKLSVRVKKMQDIGLWSYEVQLPDEQTLERLHLLDRDIVKRKKDIHLPETGKKQIYKLANIQYNEHSRIRRREQRQKARMKSYRGKNTGRNLER